METSEVISQPACSTRDTAIVGAAAGLTAGLAMAMWAMLTSVWHGLDILASFQSIGATFMGPNATHASFAMTAYGVVVHAVTSAGLGMLFAALLPPTCSSRFACAAGLGFGLAVLLGMTFVLTPAVNPVMRHAVAAIPRSWAIQHAIFGATLGLVPAYWRFYREEERDVGKGSRLTIFANSWSLIKREEGVARRAVAKLPTARRRPLRRVEILGPIRNGGLSRERNARSITPTVPRPSVRQT